MVLNRKWTFRASAKKIRSGNSISNTSNRILFLSVLYNYVINSIKLVKQYLQSYVIKDSFSVFWKSKFSELSDLNRRCVPRRCLVNREFNQRIFKIFETQSLLKHKSRIKRSVEIKRLLRISSLSLERAFKVAVENEISGCSNQLIHGFQRRFLFKPRMIIYEHKRTAEDPNHRLNKVSVSHTYTNPLLNYYTSERFMGVFVIHDRSTALDNFFTVH